jgi:nucleotide-binding universal stress UspA family protein
MFKNILIPISSEFYQKEVFQRGAFLAEKFDSTIHLIYIIEEKTLDQIEKRMDAYRTKFDKAETKKEIIKRYIHAADTIVFDDAKRFFRSIPFGGEVIEGEFSRVIKGQINKHKYDLILMGFEKECLLHYRLFEELDIPIWVESGTDTKNMLAICSNLAPNQKVPEMSLRLSEILGWDLHMVYVVDVQDAVEVDSKGKRSEKKSEHELLARGQQFISEMEKKGIDVTLVKGSLEKETVKAAMDIGAGLVILGREQKKRSVLGIPVKGVKRKMAETCQYSILFVH